MALKARMQPNAMIESIMTEVQALLRPFEARPTDWASAHLDKARMRYAVALSVSLTVAAYKPGVLIELVSSIAEKFLRATHEESFDALQITFGVDDAESVKNCYRIIIPAKLLNQAAQLQRLPETRYRNSPGMQGFWYPGFRPDD
jgi:hypothetical protein